MAPRSLVQSARGECTRRNDHSHPVADRTLNRREECLGHVQDAESFDHHPSDTFEEQGLESGPRHSGIGLYQGHSGLSVAPTRPTGARLDQEADLMLADSTDRTVW